MLNDGVKFRVSECKDSAVRIEFESFVPVRTLVFPRPNAKPPNR